MKIDVSYSKFYSFLLSFFMVIGVQNMLNSQITVFNTTPCTMTVYVGQYDLSTIVPCDLCPINPPTAVNIPPFSSTNIFGQDVCGEDFGWIAWTNNITGTFGVSPNPGLPLGCVPSILGPACTGGPTNAFWIGGGGSGPVQVAIF